MEHKQLNSAHSLRSENGVALILVLMLVVLTTIMILAFFLSVQTETRSVRSVVSGQNSKQLADLAVQTVVNQIQQATTQAIPGASPAWGNVSWASQPGMIRCYDNTSTNNGNPDTAYAWFKLYSAATETLSSESETLANVQADLPTGAWATAGSPNYGVYTDINSPVYASDGKTLEYPIVNPTGATSVAAATSLSTGTFTSPVIGFDITTTSVPGYTASGGAGSGASPTNNPAAMPVLWIYILKNGTQVPAVATGTSGVVTVAGASSSNPIVGRIAYWTDDDTCKLNINTAGDGTYFDTPRFESPNLSNNLPSVTPPAQDADIVIERQMAATPPVAGEFQRYMGGPAQTRLSYVLGSTIANSGVVNKSNLMTLLSPFMQWGGSEGGIYTEDLYSSQVATTNTLTVPMRQTPYATLDEWMFSNQQLNAGSRVPTPGTVATSPPNLLTNTNLQQLRFFLSANSDAPEVNLFGQPRISMWPIYTGTTTLTGTANLATNALPAATPGSYYTPFDQMIANAATLNPTPAPSSTKTAPPYCYYFGRANATSPTFDWDGYLSPSSTGTFNYNNKITAYATNTRNQNLFLFLHKLSDQPIPGYGYSFTQKYGILNSDGSLTAGGETDQILTEIFDYCRSLDPQDDLVSVPYASTGQGSSPSTNGGDQVTPIVTPTANFAGSYTTKGFGRFATIGEVSLDITQSEPPTTATPQVETITGVIYLNLFCPSEGYDNLNKHMRIVMSSPTNPTTYGLVQVKGSNGTTYKLFPYTPTYPTPANNGANSGRTVFSVLTYPNNGSGGNYAFNDTNVMRWGGMAGVQELLLGQRHASFSGSTTMANNYELSGLEYQITSTITLTMPATPLEFKIYDTDALPGSTSLNGGGDGYPAQITDGLVQDIIVQLPAITTPLPLPTIYSGNNLDYRIVYSNYDQGSVQGLPIVQGDIVQSVEAGYNGDTRLVAAQEYMYDTASGISGNPLGSGPSPAFTPHRFYGMLNEPSTGLTMAHSQVTIRPHYRWYGYSIPGTGQLVPTATYDASVQPTTGFIDATVTGVGSPSLTGDWDNGTGGFEDGPFINKADEAGGQYNPAGNGYGASGNYIYPQPYYNGWANQIFMNLSAPNRLVASPVMFGSLPTGVPLGKYSGTVAAPVYSPVYTVQGQSGQAIPWQTLLFRPQPNHYGSSNASGGSPTTIEDEELLDWFWMPQVEPYAISETLDTAGKVNMNYQIAPFTYITRASALMGVLGSEYVISCPTSAGSVYKKSGLTSTKYPTYRSPVKVLKTDGVTLDDDDGTLRQFKDRFNIGGVFRSAAEICDIYLEPTTDTSGNVQSWGQAGTAIGVGTSDTTYIAAAQAYWANNQLTGDNTRERPYNGLYSRLTTKSNTYTVHVRAQSLTAPSNLPAGEWIENPQLVSSEYRGSVTINRYLDPQDSNIPDFADPSKPLKYSLDNYYKYRVLETRRFLP